MKSFPLIERRPRLGTMKEVPAAWAEHLHDRNERRRFFPHHLPGLRLWLDCSDWLTLYQDSAMTSLIAADGQSIGAISDKSGNGNHAVQLSAGKRPLAKASVANRLAAALFDGVDDELQVANVPALNPAELTVFVVGSYAGAAGYEVFVAKAASAGWSDGGYALARNNTAASFDFWVDSFSAHNARANLAPGVLSILTGCYDRASVGLSVNGAAGIPKSYTPAITSGTAPLKLGNANGGAPLSGYIGEVVFYERGLKREEQAAVETYLLRKWRLY